MSLRAAVAVLLSSAPLLVRAVPWNDSCTGLSKTAFIVILVESIVLFLIFALSLCLCSKIQHQKRRMYPKPKIEFPPALPRSPDSSPVDLPNGDIEQSAALLRQLDSHIPNLLRPGSVSISTRSTLYNPAFYAYSEPNDRHSLDKEKHGHTISPLAVPAQSHGLVSMPNLPNPHSADHSQDPTSSPPPSPPPDAFFPPHSPVLARNASTRSTGSWIGEGLGVGLLSRGDTTTATTTDATRTDSVSTDARPGLHSGPAAHHPHVVMPVTSPPVVSDAPEFGDTDDLSSFEVLAPADGAGRGET